MSEILNGAALITSAWSTPMTCDAPLRI